MLVFLDLPTSRWSTFFRPRDWVTYLSQWTVGHPKWSLTFFFLLILFDTNVNTEIWRNLDNVVDCNVIDYVQELFLSVLENSFSTLCLGQSVWDTRIGGTVWRRKDIF